MGGLEGTCNPLGPRYTSGHVTLHVLSGLEGTCNPPGPRYTSGSQVHVALHVLGIFAILRIPGTPPGPRYTPGSQVHPRVPGIPPVPRYTPGSQVHPRVSLTPLRLRYMLRFMFWVYLKVPAILRIPGTPPGPRYTPGSQVHPRAPGTPPVPRYTLILARGLGDLTPNGPGALGPCLTVCRRAPKHRFFDKIER